MTLYWFQYINYDLLPRPPSTLVLCHLSDNRRLLSFDGGEWHEDGWRMDLGGRHMVLNFNAKGPSRPRHHVRLQRVSSEGGPSSWVGYDYRHCFMIYLIFRISTL